MHDPDNILLELVFIFLHLFLFITCYEVMKRKIMQPAVLFSFVWFIILLLHFIFSFTLLDELFPLSTSTYFIFFVGAIAFCFGSFIQTVISEKSEIVRFQSNYTVHIPETKVNRTLQYIFVAIIIIGLPFYIQASYRVFLASNIDSFFKGLRTELSYGDENIGPLKYLTSLSFVVFAINLYAFHKEKNAVNRSLLIISFLVTLIYASFVTGRSLIFMILAVYTGISYMMNTKFSFKRIINLGLTFIIFFIAVGIMYGKGGDAENTTKENILPAAQTTAVYLVSPLNAMDWDLHHQFRINHNGNNSLRFFMKMGEQLNWIPNAKVNELIQPFVLVPYPTNVYTVYSPYIKDFGKLYAWFILAIFGFLHTWLYNKAISTKSIRFCLYYSFLLFPLLISFFMDFYLTISSLWIQIIFFIEIILQLNNYFLKRGNKTNLKKAL